MNYSEENMGTAFKKALEGFEIKPSNSVWENVNKANLQTGVTSPLAQFSKLIYGIAAALIVTLTAYFIFAHVNTNNVETPLTDKVNITEKPLINNTNAERDTIDALKGNQLIYSIPQKQAKELTKSKVAIKLDYNDSVKFESANAIRHYNELSDIDSLESIYTKQDKVNEKITTKDEINIASSDDLEVIDTALMIKEDISSIVINDTFAVSYGDNPIICFGEDALLVAQKGFIYQWNTGDRDNQISVSPIENSNYEVTVTNNIGQKNIHTFKVTIDKECSALLLPSAFTPNGDGKNDVFKAAGIGILNLNITVYNSLGQRLFETKNIDQSWDGRFNGEMMPANTYFYHASYVDAKGKNHIKRGQITLIR